MCFEFRGDGLRLSPDAGRTDDTNGKRQCEGCDAGKRQSDFLRR